MESAFFLRLFHYFHLFRTLPPPESAVMKQKHAKFEAAGVEFGG